MSKNIEVELKGKTKKIVEKQVANYIFNPKTGNETQRQMKALLIGLVPSKKLNLYFNSLTTGWRKEKARKSLKLHWQIKDTNSVHETLDYIMNEGDRTIFNIMLPHFLNTSCKEERKMKLQERFMAVELIIDYSDKLSDCLEISQKNQLLAIKEEDLRHGILAWDMCQIIIIARLAFDADYLTEKQAWNYILQAYEICLSEFDDWTEISKSILIGGGMKSGDSKLFKTFLSISTDTLCETKSPWKSINFK